MAKVSTAQANKNLHYARKLIAAAQTIGDVDLIDDVYTSLVAGSNDRKRQLHESASARRAELPGSTEEPCYARGTFRRHGGASGWYVHVTGDGHATAEGRYIRAMRANRSEDIVLCGPQVSTAADYSMYEVGG